MPCRACAPILWSIWTPTGRNNGAELWVSEKDTVHVLGATAPFWTTKNGFPFIGSHSGITFPLPAGENGAESRTRTDDLLITNQLLYQLSYFGLQVRLYRCAGGR